LLLSQTSPMPSPVWVSFSLLLLSKYYPPQPVLRHYPTVFFLQFQIPSFTSVQKSRQSWSLVHFNFFLVDRWNGIKFWT
jgi:hypothetical protein